MMPEDFTKLPVGHVLPGQGKIGKCPKCGRNGLVLVFQGFGTVEHFGIETFITAAGQEHGERRRAGYCLIRKLRATQTRQPSHAVKRTHR